MLIWFSLLKKSEQECSIFQAFLGEYRLASSMHRCSISGTLADGTLVQMWPELVVLSMFRELGMLSCPKKAFWVLWNAEAWFFSFWRPQKAFCGLWRPPCLSGGGPDITTLDQLVMPLVLLGDDLLRHSDHPANISIYSFILYLQIPATLLNYLVIKSMCSFLFHYTWQIMNLQNEKKNV